MTNTVNKPSHYIGVNGMEVEEVLQNFIPKYKNSYTGHRVSSAVEYLLRAPDKNGLEDLKKARANLDQVINYEERKKIDLQDLQQENELNSFLRSLSDMPKQDKWVSYLVPNSKVSTFYGGTNLND